MSTYFFRVPAAAVRWSIHLLVRLVIAATCNSPAAAFYAAHVLHAAEVMLWHGHSLAVCRREARSNSQPAATSTKRDRGVRKTMTDLTESTLRGLGGQLPGRTSRPGDDRYAAATAMWAKPVGLMPRMVVHCRTMADIQLAIAAARSADRDAREGNR